ncbi:MAG: sulfatase [Saprospiraceae bacterium]|nr:sulfatase [Saprospiraceae bacterium]
MRNYLFLFFILVQFNCKVTEEIAQQPNVVFILVDDLGWADLGCYGSTFYETPNLDRLAAESVRFTNAYAAHPVCSPTRAAIMSGKNPARLHMTDWIPGRPTEKADNPSLITPEDLHNLPAAEITLAETFQKAGYKTCFVGKWHLGETEASWPQAHGFDVNKGGCNWGSPSFGGGGGYYAPYGNPQLADGPDGEYLTDRLTNESIQFIEASADQPFFLYLSFYTVHTPIEGCKTYDDIYRQKQEQLPDSGIIESVVEHDGLTRINQSNAKYAAMLRSLDDNVGRLIDALKASGNWENTMLVFTSDNGGLSTLRKPGPTSVKPLRAGKGWCYEGGIRVPLIIKYPSMVSRGTTTDAPAISMDYYPTLLDFCNLPKMADQHQDGISLRTILENPNDQQNRTFVWHYPHYHGSMWRPGSAIRKNDWKLVHFYEGDQVELFDLSEDLREQIDLADSLPDRAALLKAELQSSLAEMNAQMVEKMH